MESGAAIIRESIESPEISLSPSIHDGLSARVVDDMDFTFASIGGANLSQSRMGREDVGYLDFTENVEHSRRIVNCVDIPLLVDADNGYGNPIHVHRVVEEFEKIGIAGVNIEDQVMPKRCGHMEGKSVIPIEDMKQKVRAAIDARQDDDFIVVARTDSRQAHGVDEAIRRLNAYAEAGADVVNADGLLSEEEIKRVATETDAPLRLNIGFAIRDRSTTPLVPLPTLEEWGVAIASISGRLASGAAIMGMQNAFEAIQETADREEVTRRPELTVDFDRQKELFDFDEIQAMEEKYS